MQKFAVIGLGRFGMSIVHSLVSEGADVLAIDSDIEKVEEVKDEVAFAVKLDGTDEKALKGVGLEKVDVAIVAIGENFESCLLAVIMAKQAGVKRVIARAVSDLHARILGLVGADEVVNPVLEYGKRLGIRLVRTQVMDYIDLGEGYSLMEVKAPKSFIGKSLIELDLRKKYGVNLVGVRRHTEGDEGREQVLPVADPEETIRSEDTLLLVGNIDDLEQVTKLGA